MGDDRTDETTKIMKLPITFEASRGILLYQAKHVERGIGTWDAANEILAACNDIRVINAIASYYMERTKENMT